MAQAGHAEGGGEYRGRCCRTLLVVARFRGMPACFPTLRSTYADLASGWPQRAVRGVRSRSGRRARRDRPRCAFPSGAAPVRMEPIGCVRVAANIHAGKDRGGVANRHAGYRRRRRACVDGLSVRQRGAPPPSPRTVSSRPSSWPSYNGVAAVRSNSSPSVPPRRSQSSTSPPTGSSGRRTTRTERAVA